MLPLVRITLLALAISSTNAACTRSFLKSVTSAYVSGQTNGQPLWLAALTTPNTTYTENALPLPLEHGILSQAIGIDHAFSIHDPVSCSTFTELIAASDAHPYVIATRMVFDSVGTRIEMVESIVSDEGDWAFNATGYLFWTEREEWGVIPEEKRDSREVIQAAGDAYFDRFANVNVSVPYGTRCARLEGGAYTGGRNLTGNTCDLGLPSKTKVTDRRYVIDEEYGVVNVFVGFPGLDRTVPADAMPDSHLFRVEEGSIRYIHTVSSCVHAGCGVARGIPARQRSRARREKVWRFGVEGRG
ncbi:hypothetical protein GE09DRAFT_944784 [Coniochaeta sp. 2T2.1]|nr:hypothetical protein GE09DRAFT_944784 [Coniochaeta sp. 2T2.1]